MIVTAAIALNNVSVTFEDKTKGSSHGADIDRLPQAIEYQHMLVKEGTHSVVAAQSISEQLRCQSEVVTTLKGCALGGFEGWNDVFGVFWEKTIFGKR